MTPDRVRRRSARAAVWLLALALPATGAGPAAAADPPRALATIGMIADVAGNVAGPCAAVEALMGPGVDPHLYQASANDVQKFQQADVIFYSGYSLEGQLGEVLKQFGKKKPTVAVSTVVDQLRPSRSPSRTCMASTPICGWTRACGRRSRRPSPPSSASWCPAARPISLRARTPMPPARRAPPVDQGERRDHPGSAAHPRDRARRVQLLRPRYGIEVAGIQGISTASEAGVSDIRRMVDVVVERQVPAVFIESTINPRTIQAVVDAAAQRGHAIRIGGQLYSDAMGAPGTAGGTYIGMLVENTRTIVEALGGAPTPLPGELRGLGQPVGRRDRCGLRRPAATPRRTACTSRVSRCTSRT